jgi:hypothetical protein
VLIIKSSNIRSYQTVCLVPMRLQVEQTQSYTVNGQSERAAQFTVYKNTPGTYTVDVNGKQTSFTVIDSRKESAGSPNVILLICCFAAITVVSVLLVKHLSS